jgi:hypothetical protein
VLLSLYVPSLKRNLIHRASFGENQFHQRQNEIGASQVPKLVSAISTERTYTFGCESEQYFLIPAFQFHRTLSEIDRKQQHLSEIAANLLEKRIAIEAMPTPSQLAAAKRGFLQQEDFEVNYVEDAEDSDDEQANEVATAAAASTEKKKWIGSSEDDDDEEWKREEEEAKQWKEVERRRKEKDGGRLSTAPDVDANESAKVTMEYSGVD